MKRPWAAPLVPLYRAGVLAKNQLHTAGLLPVKRLVSPVISVGSLSAGGAGKTPVVKMLAGLLARQGLRADVLSRGYRRVSEAVEEVDPNGSAERFGDEPLELAQAGCRVFVGAERFAAGMLAESQVPGPDVYLLDDGFQHRRLARALDLVLVTLTDIYDSLLPAGDLREPLSSLARANVLVLREEEAAEVQIKLLRLQNKQVWLLRRSLRLSANAPTRPLMFCGIARPESFRTMLQERGVEPAACLFFSDHHRYTAADLQRLVDAARKAGANGFITTAKDRVKLTLGAINVLATVGPVSVAALQVDLLDEVLALAKLQAVIAHG